MQCVTNSIFYMVWVILMKGSIGGFNIWTFCALSHNPLVADGMREEKHGALHKCPTLQGELTVAVDQVGRTGGEDIVISAWA